MRPARSGGCRPITCDRWRPRRCRGTRPRRRRHARHARAGADVGQAWDVGELVLWRFRGGLPAVAPAVVPAPDRVRAGRRCAGRRANWAALGEPYAQAVALLGAASPTAARGDRNARPARRDRRGRPRARSAAPSRRRPRPARAAARDARQSGRPDRPPARGARARGSRDCQTRRSRTGTSCRPRPPSTRRGDAGQARRALTVRRCELPRAGSGSPPNLGERHAQAGGESPMRDAPGGRNVGSSDRFNQEVPDDRDRCGLGAQGAPSHHVGFGRLPVHGGDVPAAARPPARLRGRDRPGHERARRRRRHGQRVAARGESRRARSERSTPEQLDAGRCRAEVAGLELEWRQADAERLPL